MNILHTIPTMGIASGGPAACLYNLVKGLSNCNVKISVLTFQPPNSDQLISEERFIHAIQSPFETRYAYSTLYKKELKQYANVDIIHANALWQYTTHASSLFARKKGIPYIISPHGMLYPEGLKKSSLFKRIALPLYQRKDLELATVIHATCVQEYEYIRALGFTNPIAVIPNAINIELPLKFSNSQSNKKKIGFLGRFAPIKNLELLIEAWAISEKNHTDWELVLIGDGEPLYTESLKLLSQKLGIVNIRFTGFLNGEEKKKAIKGLSYLVLPSKSENFGMVVPEALFHEIPVIASKGTPWEELNSCNAGWWIDIGVASLVEALNQAIQLSDNDRQLMGQNGRKLVEENYSIESVASKMIELYQWILNGGEKPEFVFK